MRLISMPAKRVLKDEAIRSKGGVKAIKTVESGKMIKFIYHDDTFEEFHPDHNVDVLMSD